MARTLGTLALDDGVNSFLTSIIPPTARVVQTEQYPNRAGRLSQVRRDWAGMSKLPILGTWLDGGGKYWRDFLAALYGTRQAVLSFPDGTCYYCVDVETVVPKCLGGIGGVASPQEGWAYVANCISYEPFRREMTPALSAPVTLATGNGTYTTSFNATCVGTAESEPTWQFTLVIPFGVNVTQITLQNTATGDTVTVPGMSGIGNNTFYICIDASGGVGLASASTVPPTPGNNLYGLLAFPTLGYGVSGHPAGFSPVDFDFTGTIPVLKPSTAPTVPPTSNVNTMVASITATAALTSASLLWLAPARWVR